ncbi:MAG: hypothetical protein FVQ85_21075 [Planctomycetes bacterium]|nr:hypothetical protein [Planctomycetota bacterium]
MKKKEEPKQVNFGAKEYFEVYWSYCSALRNWFVVFGVGGCILFVSDKAAIFKEFNKPIKIAIVISFISGVALQILLAMLNKWIHWYIYWGEENQDFQESRLYQIAERVSTWFWIDVSIDLLTIIAFGIATGCVFYQLFC